KHVTGYAPYSVNAYDESDERIAAILAEQLVRANTTIQENRDYYTAIVEALLSRKSLTQSDFVELSIPFMNLSTQVGTHDYSMMWEAFKKKK
ncbi:hypothetical protein ACVTE8_15740, partial [Staphylococcus aureus]